MHKKSVFLVPGRRTNREFDIETISSALGLCRDEARQFTHPVRMDSEVVSWIIQKHSKPGELVLDPMCGIGTVPLIALQLGRDAKGFDIVNDYVRLGNFHIAQSLARSDVLSAYPAQEMRQRLQTQPMLVCFSPPQLRINRPPYPPHERQIGNYSQDQCDLWVQDMDKVISEIAAVLSPQGFCAIAYKNQFADGSLVLVATRLLPIFAKHGFRLVDEQIVCYVDEDAEHEYVHVLRKEEPRNVDGGTTRCNCC
jgi:SAM-dependent methyltransferase